MQSPTSRRSLLNYIGIFILLAGMGVGEFIYWRSFQGGSWTDDEQTAVWAHHQYHVNGRIYNHARDRLLLWQQVCP